MCDLWVRIPAQMRVVYLSKNCLASIASLHPGEQCAGEFRIIAQGFPSPQGDENICNVLISLY